MRSIRSTIVALLVLGGSAGVVHAQATQPAPDASRREAMKARHGGPGRGERGLFRGIPLSDAEKAGLKTVREKYQPQFASLRESFKPQREELRAARQRGDTAAVKAVWAKSADQREKMRALQTRMNDDLRAQLTADHRAQFDTNVASLKERMAKRGSKASRTAEGKASRPREGRRGER